MVVLEIENVEIDHCLSCGGVWLDAGELEMLLDAAANKERLMDSLSQEHRQKERSIRCPICSKKLEKVTYGTGDKVLLDVCPRNDGLWFDRGELNQVLQMGEFPAEARVYGLLNEVFGKR